MRSEGPEPRQQVRGAVPRDGLDADRSSGLQLLGRDHRQCQARHGTDEALAGYGPGWSPRVSQPFLLGRDPETLAAAGAVHDFVPLYLPADDLFDDRLRVPFLEHPLKGGFRVGFDLQF